MTLTGTLKLVGWNFRLFAKSCIFFYSSLWSWQNPVEHVFCSQKHLIDERGQGNRGWPEAFELRGSVEWLKYTFCNTVVNRTLDSSTVSNRLSLQWVQTRPYRTVKNYTSLAWSYLSSRTTDVTGVPIKVVCECLTALINPIYNLSLSEISSCALEHHSLVISLLLYTV